MRNALFAIVLAACGGNDPVPLDASEPDPVPDPFAGMFEDPAELTGEGCAPGSLAGFARAGFWPSLAMRTELAGGLRVHVMNPSDTRAPHVLDDDVLFARVTTRVGATWHLRAIAICGVDAGGTLVGGEVACTDQTACTARPFVAEQLRRIVGEAEGDHLTKLGEFRDWPDGATLSVRVHRDAAYVARGGDGLRVVSITDPTAPFTLAHYGAVDVVDLELVRGIDGKRYLIAVGTPASHVLDISNPSNPRLVASVAAAHAAFVDGSIAYFVDGDSSRVTVYELGVPDCPRLRATYEPPGAVRWHDGFAANGIAYLGDAAGSGIHVIDFRDLTNPHELAAELAGVIAYAPWVTSVGDITLVLAAEEHAVRILDGDSLVELGAWQLRDAVALRDVRASGNRAYVAHYRDGVRVVDLADPTAPVLAGYFNTWIESTGTASPLEGAFAVDLDEARGRIYVADTIRGLVILQGDAAIFP